MQPHHKRYMAIAAIAVLAGWLAWSILLTDSEMEKPPAAQSN